MKIDQDLQQRTLWVEMTPDEFAAYDKAEPPPAIEMEREQIEAAVGSCEVILRVRAAGGSDASA